jgi:hypothetical protein
MCRDLTISFSEDRCAGGQRFRICFWRPGNNEPRQNDIKNDTSRGTQTLQNISSPNFRMDVDGSGRIGSTDVFIVRQQTMTALP